MATIIINFGTPEPFRFKEPSLNENFEARLRGKAYISEYDTSLYKTEDDLTKAIRSNIGHITEESLASWPSNDIMSSKKEDLLNSFFKAAYEKMGIKAEFAVESFVLTEESNKSYQNKKGNALFGMFPGMNPANQPKLSDLQPEEHGPVVEICSDYSSHGMAMGSDTSGKEVVRWQEDGTVLIEISDRRYGKETYEKHLAGSDASEKLREYVKESHVAEMAQVKAIPNPYQMTDYSSSSHITFTFLDGGVMVNRRLDCGSCWNLQQKTIGKIRDLIKECIDTGKCLDKTKIGNDTNTTMSGIMGTTNQGMKIKTPGAWRCSCNQENTGKFCVNCGSPKPSGKWKCPNCNSENEGRFCAGCGAARP